MFSKLCSGSAGATGYITKSQAEGVAQSAASRYASEYLTYCSMHDGWNGDGFSYNGTLPPGVTIINAKAIPPTVPDAPGANYVKVSVSYRYTYDGSVYSGTFNGGRSVPQ